MENIENKKVELQETYKNAINFYIVDVVVSRKKRIYKITSTITFICAAIISFILLIFYWEQLTCVSFIGLLLVSAFASIMIWIFITLIFMLFFENKITGKKAKTKVLTELTDKEKTDIIVNYLKKSITWYEDEINKNKQKEKEILKEKKELIEQKNNFIADLNVLN